jgi:hypothetical protein
MIVFSSSSTYYAKAFLASPLFYQFSKFYSYPIVPDYSRVSPNGALFLESGNENLQFFTSSRFVLNYLSRKHKSNFFSTTPTSLQNLAYTYRHNVKPYKHFFVPVSFVSRAAVTPVFLKYYNFDSSLFYHSFFRQSVLHNIFFFRLFQQRSIIHFSQKS